MKLEAAFSSGALVHPLKGAMNSVDLFRATSHVAGGPTLPSTRNSESLAEQIGHHDHYLFVLVDGLGYSLRDRFPRGGFFESHLHDKLHSVFPSTTAVALSSLATGAWPAEHGVTGWFTYFPEHGRVLAPLLFRERGTEVSGEELGLSVHDLVNAKPILGSFFRTVASVLPHTIKDGSYAKWSRDGSPIHPFQSLGQARRKTVRRIRRAAGPTYSYLYITTVDSLSHRHGAASDEVTAEIGLVDGALSRIRDALPESVRMIVTADHGLVDIEERHHFTFRDSDDLAKCLLAGQTGEGTTPVFHVRNEDAFLNAFAAHPASEHFTLYRPEELAAMELYGPVALSEPMRAHLGDYVGIATDPVLLEYVAPGRNPIKHIGVHGGLRPAEIEVPLFLA